jgi:hypothetical protein
MPVQPTSISGILDQVQDSPAVADAIAEAILHYPIPQFEGQPRWPSTRWMITDLVAFPPSSPDRPVTRTFQARELINDNISVTLPELRAQSFFAEVRKLLVFCARINEFNLTVWDDKALNKCSLAVQNAEIVALTDDTSLWNGEEMLEPGNVVELFERATDKGLEKLVIYVAWCDSSLLREFSSVRQQVRQRSRSTEPGTG